MTGKRIARVFPRCTAATPNDEMAFTGPPPLLAFMAGALPAPDEVHISVTFTWDKTAAVELARQWLTVAPVKMGGPAFDWPIEEFTPGLYIKNGYTITSRGCPNKCPFCRVRKPLKELPIHGQVPEGWKAFYRNWSRREAVATNLKGIEVLT